MKKIRTASLVSLLAFCFSANAQINKDSPIESSPYRNVWKNQMCSHRNLRLLPPTDPSNARSDTLDVLKYTIDLDMTQIFSNNLVGHCTIDFKSKMDATDWISLDLLSLAVDSITSSDGLLNFDYVGPLLVVDLPVALNQNDLYSIVVHYHGDPVTDATWGGFYTSSGYAYNLGVGFDADPHNFGRVWFPCFDNFVERSAYELNVLTADGKTTYCNGLRTGVEEVGVDSLLTHWMLEEEIPSYLACVAVGDYVHSEQTFESTGGNDIPVWLTSKSADSTDFKNSLINLLPCLVGFEENYGPYRFPRVGYCAVPFNGGAMEHATNIAYPLFAIDGSLDWETLYAHELSHMWWGDNTTCRTQEDMWLNEGMAVFSESLFIEKIYGWQAYFDYARANHKDVLLHAHQDDGDYLPVSGIDHEHTYGSTVYKKGADVAHSLRGYMGDEDFFAGLTSFQQEFSMKDVSSEDFRDHMQQFTEADLTSFFDDWVFAPGFPEFRIADFGTDTGIWDLYIEQHSHYSPQLYDNVPLLVTILGSNGQRKDTLIVVSSEDWVESIFLPGGFEPFAVYLNGGDGIMQAVLGEEKFIHGNPLDDFDYAEMDIDADDLGSADSIWMRVENHWAEADFPHLIPGTDYFISPDRWWRVDGNIPDDAVVNGTIRYYGSEGAANYFDPEFFTYLDDNGYTEDSLVLLYRTRESDGMWPVPWQEWNNYTVNIQGSNTNWTGRIDISDLQPGDYAWAVHTGVVGVGENSQTENGITVVLNNANTLCVTAKGESTINVYTAIGQMICEKKFEGKISFDVSEWARGTYTVYVSASENSFTKKIILP